jgi:hypothetical protein
MPRPSHLSASAIVCSKGMLLLLLSLLSLLLLLLLSLRLSRTKKSNPGGSSLAPGGTGPTLYC